MRILKLVFVSYAVFAAVIVTLGAAWYLSQSSKPGRSSKPPVRRQSVIRPVPDAIEERYLGLMKQYLTRYDFGGISEFDTKNGVPPQAETMIGMARLDNIQECVKSVIREKIPGDLLEAGVWRGGACIFMRAALKAYGESEQRNVWVADSFEGLPKSDKAYPADAGFDWNKIDILAVSLEEVQENFRRYSLLDSRVRFLKGWFKDTLPHAPIGRLAVLRSDGDMYESTIQTLEPLYDKVSPGGYIILDDYNYIEASRKATDDFRRKRGITDPIIKIDAFGAYWRKSR